MPSKYQRPPIWAEIGDRLKHLPPRAKNAHLDDDDKLLILWGTSRGWPIKRIAQALPSSPTTVKNYRKNVYRDPVQVFDLPVLVQVAAKNHQCQMCGESRPTRTKAMRHVLSHFLAYEMARDFPLGGLPKLL
jgi:hypothetical protein